MPYVNDTSKSAMLHRTADNPGELNYTITVSLLAYMERHGISYTTINDIIGALEGAKQEFYSRIAVPYEDRKRKENGDIYKKFVKDIENEAYKKKTYI